MLRSRVASQLSQTGSEASKPQCLVGPPHIAASRPTSTLPSRGISMITQSSTRANAAAQTQQLVTEPITHTDTDRSTVTEEQPAREHATVNWTARWWPVTPLDNLDPKIPEHVDLLGKSLVVWADSKGQWHCFDDQCPHRMAPLSEGRIEGDTLMCSYHGWCFNGQGSCTRIPQLEFDPKAHQSACASKRAKPARYPTRMEHGLLWIWPEAGEEAAQRAAQQTQLPVYSGHDGGTTWYMRDVPQRYDTLIENLVDPTHAPFAHHKAAFAVSRYRMPPTWNQMEVSDITLDGFKITGQYPWGKDSVYYETPFLVKYSNFLQLLCIPTKPGWARIMYRSNFPPPLWSKMPAPVKWLYDLKVWATVVTDHAIERNAFLDGDVYLLHVLDRRIPVSKGIGLKTAVRSWYMPSPSDGGVLAWRKWISEFAGPIPTCRPEDQERMPPQMTKKQALDRWEQHTQHCSHCKNALAWIDRLLPTTTVLGYLALMVAVAVSAPQVAAALPAGGQLTLAAVSQAVAALPLVPVVPCMAAAGVFALLHRALGNLRKEFFGVDFIHALRD